VIPLAAFALAFLAVAIVYFTAGGDPLSRLKIVVGYIILILLFFFGLMVLIAMAMGKIDLSLLLAESGGGASISRFQLLLFTIVIAFSLFLLILSDMKFPDIPTSILTLLGISASTYAVSKGIQAGNPGMAKTGTEQTTTTIHDPATGQTQTTTQTKTTPQADPGQGSAP
jgi:hypothetical protein